MHSFAHDKLEMVLDAAEAVESEAEGAAAVDFMWVFIIMKTIW